MIHGLVLLLFLLYSFSSISGELKIHFKELKNNKGNVLYLIFNDEEGFPDKNSKSFKEGKIAAHLAATEGLYLENIPDGSYAVTAFHDENSNDKLDSGLFGIPKEGFAFSNNPRVLFGPPSFSKTKFKVQGQTNLKLKFKHF